MTTNNITTVTYFILQGILDIPELQVFFFLLVLLTYLITLGGNVIILILVCLDSHLHTPMYFFLCNLSILNICSTTVTLHKVFVMFVTGDNEVSYTSCMAQVYLYVWLSSNEFLLLTAMSYDRYVAIYRPLHYSALMNSGVCAALAIFCWSLSFLLRLPAMVILWQFSCYTSNTINHFLCDAVLLMDLSCSDTSTLELLMLYGSFFSAFIPFVLIVISYFFIIITIMRIKSSTGRSKAFYTCSSHLTIVSFHYLSIACLYVIPSGTVKTMKFLSLLSTAVVPMLNPFIYSLKNKDVKSAVQRRLKSFTIITGKEVIFWVGKT
ncbi:olfactory receptor 6C74-like [Hyperolius riggenbachi]|uniref:olfactory receptor 6C74-like n=1 Tax=Hyperolius riggenbachi TaxID=752182 RepID=UPI0035A3C3F4